MNGNVSVMNGNQQRNWKASFPENCADVQHDIIMKIRGEEADNFVPDKLYCSHKYHVNMSIVFPDRWLSRLPKVVVCKIKVVKEKTGEVVLKKGSPIVKGIITTGLQHPQQRGRKRNKGLYQGSLRIQFTASSYHYKKCFFIMKLEFNDPDKPDQKLLILSSPRVQVFSRKPTVGKKTLEPKVDKAPLIRKKKKKVKSQPKPKPKRIIRANEKERDEDLDDEEEEEESGQRPFHYQNHLHEGQQQEQQKKPVSDENLYFEYQRQLEKVKRIKNELSSKDGDIAEEMTLSKIIEDTNTSQLHPVQNENQNNQNNQSDNHNQEEETYNPPILGNDGHDDGFGISGDFENLMNLTDFDEPRRESLDDNRNRTYEAGDYLY